MCRFWKALYNRFDRGMHPRQSVLDYLMAIREETQQLEEQLASHEEVKQRSRDHTGVCVCVYVNTLYLLTCGPTISLRSLDSDEEYGVFMMFDD